jgi:hypothetical protein
MSLTLTVKYEVNPNSRLARDIAHILIDNPPLKKRGRKLELDTRNRYYNPLPDEPASIWINDKVVGTIARADVNKLVIVDAQPGLEGESIETAARELVKRCPKAYRITPSRRSTNPAG